MLVERLSIKDCKHLGPMYGKKPIQPNRKGTPQKVTSPFTCTNLNWTFLFYLLLFYLIKSTHCTPEKIKIKTKKEPTAAAMLPSPPSSSAAISFFDSTFSVFLQITYNTSRPLSFNHFLLPRHHQHDQAIMIPKSSAFLISRISLALSLPWRALSWTWTNNSETKN